jgi:hypothetical protein
MPDLLSEAFSRSQREQVSMREKQNALTLPQTPKHDKQ